MFKKCILVLFLLLLLFNNAGCNNKKIVKQSNDRNENVSQVEIINDYINIRKERNINSDIIGKVYKGEIYTIISLDNSVNKWVEIETENKIHGYISGVDNYVKYIESLDEKNNKYKSKYYKYEWNCDVSLTEIKTIKGNDMMFIQPRMFISTTGDLYQFSLDKKYSNEQNCKKYDTSTKFDYFYQYPNDRDISLAVNINSIYYEDNKNGLIEFCKNDCDKNYVKSVYSLGKAYRYSYGLDSTRDKKYNGEWYRKIFYVEDNKIYEYDYMYDDSRGKNKTFGNFEFASFPNDEVFISLEGRVFKTDKSYYKIGIINQQQCDEYVDIECTQGLVKFEDISAHYDDIEYFNGDYIIFKNDPNIYTYFPYY